jgi:hypothetical protein
MNVTQSIAYSPYVIKGTGISSQAGLIKSALQQGQAQTVRSLVTDQLVDQFAIAGSVDHCVEKSKELIECGLTQLIFSLAPWGRKIGPRITDAIATYANEVIPRFR